MTNMIEGISYMGRGLRDGFREGFDFSERTGRRFAYIDENLFNDRTSYQLGSTLGIIAGVTTIVTPLYLAAVIPVLYVMDRVLK